MKIRSESKNVLWLLLFFPDVDRTEGIPSETMFAHEKERQ